MLLSAVGLWAQTADLKVSTSTSSPEHVYLLSNASGALMQANTKQGNVSNAGKFAFFEGTGGAYKLYSIGEGKWVSYTKADSYSHGSGKTSLVDDQDAANAWNITVQTRNNAKVYQFAPYKNDGTAANIYMNWYANEEGKTVGFWTDAASADNGSAWKLTLLPNSGSSYYIQDKHCAFLNLDVTGTEPEQSSQNQLSTLTANPASFKIEITGDGKWKISRTSDNLYLGQHIPGNGEEDRSWNSWLTSTPIEWKAELIVENGDVYLMLKNESGTRNGYLGTANHTNGQPLYVNTSGAERLRLRLVEGGATKTTLTYTYTYNGTALDASYNESREAVVGALYPLPTRVPFGTTCDQKTGTVSSAGESVAFALRNSLPFVPCTTVDGNTNWYYLKMHSTTKNYIQNVGTQISWADDDNKLDLTDLESMSWAFVGDPINGFKLINKKGNAYVKTTGVNGSVAAFTEDVTNATVFAYSPSSVSGSQYFCLKDGDNYLNGQNPVKLYNANDAGSTIETENAIPVKFSTDEKKIYYALKSGRPGEYWYTLTDEDKIQLNAYTGADTQLWYFTATQDGNNTYVLLHPRNGKGKAMSYANTDKGEGADKIVAKALNTEGWTNTWRFGFATNGAPYGLQIPGGGNWLSNHGGVYDRNGNRNNMGLYSFQNDGGSQIYIYDVLPCTLTDNYSNRYDITAVTPVASELAIAVNGIPTSYISNAVSDGSKVTADITFPFPLSTAGNVKPTMISAFNAENYKWYADGTSVKETQNKVATSSDIATFLWSIYPQFANESFTFRIQNFATGKYIYSTSSENSTINDDAGSFVAGVVTLENEGSDLTIDETNQFKLSTGKYLSYNSSNNGKVQIMGTYSTHIGTKNTFPEASFTAEITDAKAATLYTPIAVTIPANVEAKYPANQNDGKLGYTTLSNVIPAGAAVVLTGDAATYTFNAAATEGTPLSGNMLFGYATTTAKSDVATQHTGSSVYALAKKDAGVGFYNYVGNNYRAGKAYLKVRASGARSFYSIFDEDNAETGINTIETEETAPADAPVYDLSGRRVQSAKSGLYIVNGQKVIK